MDLAAACLMGLVEARGGRSVMTIDVGDFSIYRIHGQEPVPTLTPPE